ncbi:MAG: hypothetical protein HYR60_32085 [Acidobacteria bacterium]|nr:hypothetical protein [Acidobacteriota bacterium]
MLFLLAVGLACVDCHKDLVERYARTPMANSSGAVNPALEFTGTVESTTRYEIARHRGKLELRWPGGQAGLDFFVGSRRMGRSYVYSDNGFLFQVPVGYYSTRNQWDLAPGYEHDAQPDLNRPIGPECLYCHATGARAAKGTWNRLADPAALHGVSCERCHGDAPSHDRLVNPRKLPARRRDAVCEQCHLAGEVRLIQPGKSLDDFRPGQNLADYLEVFVRPAGPESMRVNGHAEALAVSRCRQRAGDRIWCGSCHNPHAAAVTYREMCLTCHTRPHREEDCIACHMPKARAYDGGHAVFTDHSIPALPTRAESRPGEPRQLLSYFRGERASPRNLGLAYAELGSRYRNSQWVEKAWPLLRAAAQSQPRDPALYTRIASILAADGHLDQAEQYYRRSLHLDPDQYDALTGLANALARRGRDAEAVEARRKARAMVSR